jgi:hypothetical protein
MEVYFNKHRNRWGKEYFYRKMKRRTKTEGKSHQKKFSKRKIFHAVELFDSSGIIPRWLRDSAGI